MVWADSPHRFIAIPIPSESAIRRALLELASDGKVRRLGDAVESLANAPLAGLRIHLPPPRAAGLAGTRRRQDQEPEAKFGRLARLQPIHGFKRRRYFPVRQRPEVRLDGRHGRQRTVDPFPGHVLLDVAMRPTPSQHGTLSLLEAVSGRTIRDCERVRHSRRQIAASSALVSRSRAMPTGGRRSKPSPRFRAWHYAFSASAPTDLISRTHSRPPSAVCADQEVGVP